MPELAVCVWIAGCDWSVHIGRCVCLSVSRPVWIAGCDWSVHVGVFVYLSLAQCELQAVIGQFTYTYQRYIVGKVHCGERPCILVGRCGERTHISTNDTLWGKCIVRKMCASWLVVVGKIHTYVQMIHCGESALWGKSVRRSCRREEKLVSPQCKFYFPTVQCFDVRHSL